MDTEVDPDAMHGFRLDVIEKARRLRDLADSDERRAAWLDRCRGHASDADWLRGRAARRREASRRLASRFDHACRPQ